MNTMNMSGFAAEQSLRAEHGRHRSGRLVASRSGALVTKLSPYYDR